MARSEVRGRPVVPVVAVGCGDVWHRRRTVRTRSVTARRRSGLREQQARGLYGRREQQARGRYGHQEQQTGRLFGTGRTAAAASGHAWPERRRQEETGRVSARARRFRHLNTRTPLLLAPIHHHRKGFKVDETRRSRKLSVTRSSTTAAQPCDKIL